MRVLVVRLDGIGDAAVCVPLLAALRAAGHQVGVALTTRNAGLFAPSAMLAEHVLERIPWPAHGSTPESSARARTEIAAMRYDVALIASEEPEAFDLAAPVPQRVGFTTGWARPLKTWWVRGRTTRTVSRSQHAGGEDAHEVEVLYRLGSGLVAEPVPPAEPARLRAMLIADATVDTCADAADNDVGVNTDARGAGAGSSARRSGVVVQAGPKWIASGVVPERLRAALSQLAPHARIVAGPGEADALRALTGIAPIVYSSVRAWVEALDRAELVVTVDTGAAHVAGMLGVRVVDVFPDAGFAAQVRRWRPWASPYRALRASEVDGGPRGAFIEAVRDGF